MTKKQKTINKDKITTSKLANSKITSSKDIFTPEQEALMELANKYNALHRDVMTYKVALQAIPISQNMIMSICRALKISPESFASVLIDKEANKAYEGKVAEEIKKNGKRVETFNKTIIKGNR